MKEIYDKLSIDIRILNNEDVITTSSSFNGNDNNNQEAFEHDNAFFDWGNLE